MKLKAQNLDMLYFLAEEELAPFVSISAAELRSPQALDNFVRTLERELGN